MRLGGRLRSTLRIPRGSCKQSTFSGSGQGSRDKGWFDEIQGGAVASRA
jgi:hypothetical protein